MNSITLIDDMDAVTDATLPKLLRRASREGRLCPSLAKELGLETGTARCRICGMLAWDEEEARDCCVKGERRRASVGGRPRNNYTAMCVSRVLLRRGVLLRMHELGFEKIQPMAVANGVPHKVIGRLLAGSVKMIQAENWMRLQFLFQGPPPGCVEIERGGK